MGFFATFWIWLNSQMATYIGDNTARLASILEPAFITFATIYVMVWGYLQLVGKIDEPVVSGLKRILLLALILGFGLRLWLYNSLIVDTFYSGPSQIAAAMLGSTDPVATIDTIWERGGSVAGFLWDKGGVWTNVGFYLAGAAVWALMGVLCVYAMFLIALSSIALAVLLALGPLFVGFLLFDTTKRLFVAWIAQLTNYALISILTVMVAALLLQIVQAYATQTAARGTALLTVDALNMMLIAVLVFLLLRQVMPIASALAGGVALNTFGIASRSVGWGVRNTGKAAAPALALATPFVARSVAVALRGTGQAAAGSSRYVYRKTGAGIEALGRSWRSIRR
jgi:type IV secretion system protein VirB6